MTDTIFQRKTLEGIEIEGYKPEVEDSQMEKDFHKREVEWRLVKRLVLYLNQCI